MPGKTKLNIKQPTIRDGKERSSSFLITLNPNKPVHNIEEPSAKALALRLQAVGDYIIDNIPTFIKFVDDTGTEVKSSMRDHYLKKISDITDQYGAVEIGDKQHRLHLHVTFTVHHTTRVQINRVMLEMAMEKVVKLEPKSYHIDIKYSQGDFERYVTKYNS